MSDIDASVNGSAKALCIGISRVRRKQHKDLSDMYGFKNCRMCCLSAIYKLSSWNLCFFTALNLIYMQTCVAKRLQVQEAINARQGLRNRIRGDWRKVTMDTACDWEAVGKKTLNTTCMLLYQPISEIQ